MSTILIVSQLFNKWSDSEYGHYLGIDNNTGYAFCGATSDDAMVGGEKSYGDGEKAPWCEWVRVSG